MALKIGRVENVPSRVVGAGRQNFPSKSTLFGIVGNCAVIGIFYCFLLSPKLKAQTNEIVFVFTSSLVAMFFTMFVDMGNRSYVAFDIGPTYRKLLDNRKKITGIPIGKIIMLLLDQDAEKNPELYQTPIPFATKINAARTVKDKTLVCFQHFRKECCVRSLTDTLAPFVAPLDRDTLRILVKKALDDTSIYYASRTDGRVNRRYGLKEWI